MEKTEQQKSKDFNISYVMINMRKAAGRREPFPDGP